MEKMQSPRSGSMQMNHGIFWFKRQQKTLDAGTTQTITVPWLLCCIGIAQLRLRDPPSCSSALIITECSKQSERHFLCTNTPTIAQRCVEVVIDTSNNPKQKGPRSDVNVSSAWATSKGLLGNVCVVLYSLEAIQSRPKTGWRTAELSRFLA